MLKEDIAIINEYLLHGSQWSSICKKLNGRNVYDAKIDSTPFCKMNKIPERWRSLQNQLIELLNSLSLAYHPQIDKPNIFETFVIDSNDNSGNFNNVYFFIKISILKKKVMMINQHNTRLKKQTFAQKILSIISRI